MKNFQQQMIWCVATVGIAVAAPAQETSIELPPDNPVAVIKPGPGDDAVRRSCVLCHSTDYIVIQPHLDALRWDAEVKKMIAVYGARISETDAKIITDYLAKNYGADGDLQKPSSPK